MADNTPPKFSVEPTDAFMNIAIPIMRRWESGSLSGTNTIQELDALRAVPATQAELADLAQLEQMASTVYMTQNKLNESVQADKIAIELFRKVGNIRLALMSELNIAVSYIMREDIMTALEMYRDILDEAKQANIPSMQAYALQGMSAVYIEQGSWNEARIALLEAEPLLLEAPTESTDVQVTICQMYRDLTKAYIGLGLLKEAWETTRTLTRYSKTQIDISTRAYAEASTASVLAELENVADADAIIQDLEIIRNPATHYQAAVETFLKKNEEGSAAAILCQFAEYLASKGQYMNGARKAEHAAKLYKKLRMEREQTRAIALRAKLISHSD